MVDINAKFQQKHNQQQQERIRRQQHTEQYARCVEDFMNIVSIEKTGLRPDFVVAYYDEKRKELGNAEFNKVKGQAELYIQHLTVSGQINENIDWFRFVMEKITGFERF